MLRNIDELYQKKVEFIERFSSTTFPSVIDKLSKILKVEFSKIKTDGFAIDIAKKEGLAKSLRQNYLVSAKLGGLGVVEYEIFTNPRDGDILVKIQVLSSPETDNQDHTTELESHRHLSEVSMANAIFNHIHDTVAHAIDIENRVAMSTTIKTVY